MRKNLPFSNFGLRWKKSVYILTSSGRTNKYSSTPLCTDVSLHLPISLTGAPIVIFLTLICIHVALVIPTIRHSENDILSPHCSHLLVLQPSLCWNYDSPSGMQHQVPWWHLLALPRDNNSNSAKRAGMLSGRLPGRPMPLLRHLPQHYHHHPPFVRQGQGTKCWVIHIKLSGWKQLQMLLFLWLV